LAAPVGYTILSPLVGIFYRAASPDSPPFVEIGDSVEAGQTIGVVEAMKVFNEIITECPGVVAAIPTGNGELVQADQPLVILSPAE
jgi:acetyl-CoA carboxylase biotin carboxyl carrier protein